MKHPELADKILSELPNMEGGWTSATVLKERLPDSTLEEIWETLLQLSVDHPEWVYLDSLYCPGATEEFLLRGRKNQIEAFLLDGGYVKKALLEAETLKKENERYKLEMEKLRHEIPVAKWMKNTYWITLALAVISTIIGLFALFM